MAIKGPNRKHSVIDKLPQDLKDTVEYMLMTGATYAEVVEYLQQNGVSLSISSVCRYAQNYLASLEQIRIARENLAGVMQEIEKYPNLDMTQGIAVLVSHQLLNRLTQLSPEEWADLDAETLVKQCTGLIRASAYKSRIDQQNKTDLDAAWDVVSEVLFDPMATEQPELYKQITAFVDQRKAALQEA